MNSYVIRKARAEDVLALPAIDEVALENGGTHGWRSRALGQREPADVVIVRKTAALPAIMAAVIDLDPPDTKQQLSVEKQQNGSVRLMYGGRNQRFT